jgi:dTDP-glucose 4,6-dehydratase
LALPKAKNATILVASTSEVYGDPQCIRNRKNIGAMLIRLVPVVYMMKPNVSEAITMAYHTFHDVDTRIVRIFNTYGPRMRLNDGRALPAFIGQALRGET